MTINPRVPPDEIRVDPQQRQLNRPLKVDFSEVKLEWPALHIVTGKPRSGKTVLLMNLGDRYHADTKQPVYTVGKETDADPRELGAPGYYSLIKNREGEPIRIPTDCMVMGDDWQRIAPSRRSMQNVNVFLNEVHGLMHHYNTSFALDTQTATSFDRDTILRNEFHWIKLPYRKEVDFSRPEIRDDIVTAYELLDPMDEEECKRCAYLVSDDYVGLVTGIPLPPYYNDELSKLHRPRIKRWSLW